MTKDPISATGNTTQGLTHRKATKAAMTGKCAPHMPRE